MVRVATIQMQSTADVEHNLKQAGDLIKQAADEGAEFSLLPEYFPIISDDEGAKLRIQEKYGAGPIQEFLAETAIKRNMWVMGGTVPISTDDPNLVNSACLLYKPSGECVARYDKIHMFDVCVDKEEAESYNESNTIRAGHDIVTADTPLAHFGMSICYDLRFPELYREHAARGVNVITVPAAFTYSTGKRHWQLFLCARAVENLSFVIASNQCGYNTKNRRTWGHSMIIDAWGNILASLDESPGVACADLDLVQMNELRTTFPALEHRVLGGQI